MRRSLATWTVVSIQLAAPAAAQNAGAFDGLVAAERAFAAAARSGVSQAFLGVLDSAGVVFAPGPVNGRALHRDRPSPPGASLSWHPRLAAVSANGDLGYTTGPWVAGRDGVAGAWGHYLSVWRRTGGGWRLLADIGVSHPPLADHDRDPGTERFPTVERPRVPVERVYATDDLRAAAARAHAALSAGRTPDDGVLADARVYVEGRAPRHGAAVLAEVAAARTTAWRVADALVAEAADLGYLYGTFDAPAGGGNFLEVWFRTDAGWSLGLMLFQQRQGGAPGG